MNVLVASDLDRTLIYSESACRPGPEPGPLSCVEIYDERPASFMTQRAADALAALARSCTFVPVTTRIPEQYARVSLPGPPARYAITANGGLLFVDGDLDRDWSRKIAARLGQSFPLSSVWAQLTHVCDEEFTVTMRNAADLFCYAVVHTELLPSGFLADVAGWAAERGWRTSLQGRKLYWVPEALTKGAAVAEVARRSESDTVLAAGDSLLDVDLLLAADRGIYPRHGELFEQGWSAPGVVATGQRGVLAGEEILDWFADLCASAPG